MRAKEFIIAEKKKRKRQPKYAAWGPGPYGYYGWDAGYSGAGGSESGGDGVGEASYPGNIGAMEVMKFFQIADEKQKELFKNLVANGKKKLAWKLIQDVTGVKLQGKEFEDRHPNDVPQGPEVKPTMPKGTVRVDVSDVYDWYKLGMHIANLKGLGKHDFGKGPPSTIFSFGSEEEEHDYIKALAKIGLDVTDIDPAYHDKKKGIKTDPTYNVEEGLGDIVSKVKDKFAELKNKLATEGGETKQMMDIYKLALQKKATPQQIQFANNQFKDVLKMLGLGAFTALPIPGGALLIVALEKLLNKKGMSVMPSAFQAA